MNDAKLESLSLIELINHILSTHHAYLDKELPRLHEMAKQVAEADGESHPETRELLDVYAAFHAEIQQHATKEERVLFPWLCRLAEADGPIQLPFGTVANPIGAMESEHVTARAALDHMRSLTNDYTPPGDASDTYHELVERLQRLNEDTQRHIHTENEILFPMAHAVERELQGVA